MARWRLPVQIACLALFVALSVLAAWPARSPVIPSAWLVIDPLVAAVAIASARAVWSLAAWALVLVAATALFGRFFCGWACPLGTTIDLSDRLIRRQRPRLAELTTARARWKHYVLAVVLGAAIVGMSAGLVLDPLVLFTRTIALALAPAVSWLGYGSVRAARLVPGQAALSVPSFETPAIFTSMTATALVFAAILALGWISPRFWCRNLCPLGATLGWLGRWGIFRRRVSGECRSCALCARECPTNAIPADDFSRTRRGDCILCLDCQDVCAQARTTFGPRGALAAPEIVPERRRALAVLAAGAGIGILGAGSVRARPRPAHVVRPPGAIPEDEFLSRCTRCLACAESCPTNAIQPLGPEAGWAAIWTPILVPTSGGCEKPCYACTRVCPTGAIRDVGLDEKSFAKIGTARISRERCVAWEQLKSCLVCDEVCPYGAVEFLTIADHRGVQRRPVVHVEKCVGCGICEKECPVREPRAIIVEWYGEERLAEGSYITPARRRARDVVDDRNVDYLREYRAYGSSEPDSASARITDDYARPAADSTRRPSEPEEPLPPGFVFD